MKSMMAMLLMLGGLVAVADRAIAHGDAPHPKCKKGYVVSDDHRCIKANPG